MERDFAITSATDYVIEVEDEYLTTLANTMFDTNPLDYELLDKLKRQYQQEWIRTHGGEMPKQ